ncbi:hypothetical protein N2152v2_006416 [Parachlorella kessleri]
MTCQLDPITVPQGTTKAGEGLATPAVAAERPLWVLSCYASEREGQNDLAGDISPEEVRWANMQAAATMGATPPQLAAEFKAARQAKLDQFQALMKARQLPSNGGAMIPAPQNTIAGVAAGQSPPGALAGAQPFGGGGALGGASVFGQPAAAAAPAAPAPSPFGKLFGAAAPAPAFGATTALPQVAPAAAPFGAAAPAGPAPSFGQPAAQPQQQHGFGTAFGQTAGAAKPVFGVAAGSHGFGGSTAGGGFGSTPFGGATPGAGGGSGSTPFGSTGAAAPGAAFGSSPFGGTATPGLQPPQLPPFGQVGGATSVFGSPPAQQPQQQPPAGQPSPFGSGLPPQPASSSVTIGGSISANTGALVGPAGGAPLARAGLPPPAAAAGAAAAGAEPGAEAVSEADAAWRAPSFARGKIPEEPPPQIYCQG